MKYDSYKMPSGKTTVRAKQNGTVSLEDLLDEMSTSTTLTKADGMGAVTFITEFMARQLSRGSIVTIDGLGTFGVSLATDGIEEAKMDGSHVHLKRITFKATPHFKAAVVKNMNMERVAFAARNASTPRHSRQEREEIARRLAATQHEFSTEDYRSAASVSIATAHSDLKRMVNEGILTVRRLGVNKLFAAV